MRVIRDIDTYNTVKVIAAICHFISTTTLFWTKVDAINVTTENLQDREDISQTYDILISFGLWCLLCHFFFISRNYFRITLLGSLRIGLDFIGTFFVLWISLDGLSWKTYIVILTFCV
jgi:hypothetical protein